MGRQALRIGMAAAVCCGVLAAGRPAAAAGKNEAPPPRDSAELTAILAKAPKPPAPDALRELHIVLLAGPKDHGPNEHDYPLWQKRWKVLLGGKGEGDEPKVNCYCPEADQDDKLAGAPKVKVSTAWNWPTREQLDSAHLLVMFSAPRWNPDTLKDLKALLDRGGGFVMMHMAIWQDSKELADLIGMAKQKDTRYRHGAVDLKLADHPITLALPRAIHFVDETYYNFQGDPSQIAALAACDEKVGDAVRAEPMFWACERGKGRVFVCILGHFMWTFDDPFFRLLLLRGMAWAAGESPYRFDGLAARGVSLSEGTKAPEAK